MARQNLYIIFVVLLCVCVFAQNKSDSNSNFIEPDYLVTGYYYLSKTPNNFRRQLSGTTKQYYLKPSPIITVKNFTSASVDKNNFGNYYVSINLDEAGGQKWSEATGKTIGDSLAIVINNELIQVARVNAQITAPVTAVNKVGLTRSQADKYLKAIKAKMPK